METKNEPRRRRRRKDPDAVVQDLLRQAAPAAVGCLIEVLEDPSFPIGTRMDCAKEILNRVYGKSAPLAGERERAATFVLEEALRDYAV
ncbi:MAG: hypothetical protein GXX99_01590 [Clostridiales bacterium]|nr:hypothetical protein [Clostridiales bacterium]